MFLGFVYGVRGDALARQIQAIAPASWQRTLLPVPTFSERGRAFLPRIDVNALREQISSRAPSIRAAVIFAVDIGKKDLNTTAADLIYVLPRVEIVALRSKGLESDLPDQLDYYGLQTSARPVDLSDALKMFRARYPGVKILDRAEKTALQAADFREPRKALMSMHFLPRVYIDWADARRSDPKRSNHADLRDLRHPARDAMRAVIEDAQFDVSDSSGTGLHWKCIDGQHRYFGWHLKWSLAGPWGTRNHCRIHYAFDQGDSTRPTILHLGHLGEHR